VRRVFPPKADILDRRRSLGGDSSPKKMCIQVKYHYFMGNTGIFPFGARVVLEIAPEGGLG
jgi:hypothetical protein